MNRKRQRRHERESDTDSRLSNPPIAGVVFDGHLRNVLDRSTQQIKNAFDVREEDVPRCVRRWIRDEVDQYLSENDKRLDTLSWDLKWLFEDAIVENYRGPVESELGSFLSQHKRDNQFTQADIARRFGVDKATVNRWLGRKHDISLNTWCIISASADCEYKRGHFYAIRAYVIALERVLSFTKRHECYQVLPETVWYLSQHMRNLGWWHALAAQDEGQLHSYAQAYRVSFGNHFGTKARFGSLKEQLSVMADLWLEWCILELELPHGWF